MNEIYKKRYDIIKRKKLPFLGMWPNNIHKFLETIKNFNDQDIKKLRDCLNKIYEIEKRN